MVSLEKILSEMLLSIDSSPGVCLHSHSPHWRQNVKIGSQIRSRGRYLLLLLLLLLLVLHVCQYVSCYMLGGMKCVKGKGLRYEYIGRN